MKKLSLAAALAFGIADLCFAQADKFPGLEKAMDQDTYEKTGLGRLSSAERTALDSFVREYVSAKEKSAAEVASTQAVDRAVKERKVNPPEVVESRFVGAFKGYGPRTVFHLANGETWKPTNDEVLSVSPIDSPSVVILRDMFGYKMYIEGTSMVRVKRVQ